MADKKMQALIRSRRALENRLARVEQDVQRPQGEIDHAMIQVFVEDADQLRAELREWETELLSVCPEESLDEHKTLANTMSRRVNEVKAILNRISKAPEEVVPVGQKRANDEPQAEGRTRKGVKLPKLDLPKFNGNILDWTSFRDRFEAAVHNDATVPNCEKLSYLMSAVTDDAARVLKALPITDENYQQAWDILTKKFQNVREIAFTHVEKLMNVRPMREESSSALQMICDVANESVRSLQVLKIPVKHCDLFLDVIVMQKLDAETRKQWHLSLKNDEVPKFADFLDFLDSRARALAISDKARPRESSSRHRPSSSQVYLGVATKSCPCCSQQHEIYQCDKFRALPFAERMDLVKSKSLCFNCLKCNHTSRECKSKFRCRTCKRKHHDLLHAEPSAREKFFGTNDREAGKASDATSLHVKKSQECQTLLATAIIMIRDGQGHYQRVRVLLDSGSQVNLMTEECLQRLNLKRRRSSGTIVGIGGKGSMKSMGEVSFQFSSLNDDDYSNHATALILPTITSSQPSTQLDTSSWLHLKTLPLADPNFHMPGPIEALLGGDIFMDVVREGILNGPLGTPKALLTSLGWILSGTVSIPSGSDKFAALFACCELEKYVRFLWEAESLPETKVWSIEDRKCEEHYKKTHSRDASGRYVVRLPFKDDGKALGDSRKMALRRYMQNERRLMKNAEHKKKYDAVIQEYLDMGHMEPVPVKELNKDPSQVYYLPHHGVIKESSSTTKLRVVFDASAKTSSGVSMNEKLMIGPTIQNDLFSILVRVRKYQIMISADCEKMYRQVRVAQEDADFQRIFWRKHIDEPLKEYRLLTVTFGYASAPFQAIRTLHQIAQDEAENCPLAPPVLLNDFYVDDCISGHDTVEGAIELQGQLINALDRGGFPLRKWSSSHSKVLEDLPLEMRELKLPLDLNPDSTIKALGIQWHPALDVFVFKVQPTQQTESITKRFMLSELSKVFDPLGWICPVTIKAKIIFQSLWFIPIEWDEEVPENIKLKWIEYANDLIQLQQLKIERCMTISNYITCELFGFGDASESAISSVVYMKTVDQNSQSKVAIVAAKTRVRPKKSKSLPRLELEAAKLLTKLMKSLVQALKMKIDRLYAFTDSSIVWHWITSPPDKWNTYVANRVSEIQEFLPPAVWAHVPGDMNPADCASRGISTENLLNHALWWMGPEWIKDGAIPNQLIKQPDESVLEEKKELFCGACIVGNEILERFSSYYSLIRFTAYALRYAHNIGIGKSQRRIGYLTTEEIFKAEQAWVKICQAASFQEELQALRRAKDDSSKNAKITSKSIRALNPFLDDFGIIRVGGRLENASVSFMRKHPMLLPKKGKFTTMLVQYEHARTMHGGPLMILTSLQRRFWVLGAKNVARQVAGQCVKCFRFKCESSQQLMADLPHPRVQPSRPFNVCGIDYIGPFTLRALSSRSRVHFKGYIAIFTCFATKAVHCEVVSSLSTAKCLEAIRRFCDQRGKPKRIVTDCGRNFIGARKEISEVMRILRSREHNDQVTKSLAADNVEWFTNPPYSPHFGGIWEAGCKSLKYHLRRVVGREILTYEEMLTVSKRAEAILNSRALTELRSDPNDFEPLTPAHFLIGDSLMSLPEADLSDAKMSHLTRWQHMQRMMQHFWKRWSREYLTRLQNRPKWWFKKANVKVNDLVLVREDNMPSLKWRLGRIAEVHPGNDGLVRTVTIRTQDGVIKRVISKISPLPYDS